MNPRSLSPHRCWPALLVSLVSGTVSAASRSLGHYIALGLTSSMMALVLGFMLHSRRRRMRYKSFWARNGPVLLVALAIPLILADTLRHVLQDVGAWPACIMLASGECAWYSSAEYKAGEAETVQDENLTHLSTIGGLFTIFATYLGFALLAIGTLWNADINKKLANIRERWNALRAQAAAATAASPTATYVAVN